MHIDIVRAFPRSHVCRLVLAAAAVVGGAGCAADASLPSEGDDATNEASETAGTENVGTAEQAFSWGALTPHYRSDNLPTSSNRKDLGSSSGVTCFLAGVGGNLSSSYGAPGSVPAQGTLYTVADVRVYESSGHWWLEALSGAGNGDRITGTAMCVNSVSGRLPQKGWSTGSAPVQLDESYPRNSSRRCFMTGVSNKDMHYTNNNFSASGDEVGVWEDNDGKWWLGGRGNATGTARCINVNGSYLPVGQLGSTSHEAGYNSGGVQCALRKVAGRFRSNDYGAGVFLTYEPGVSRYYLSSTSGRGAEAQCFW